MLMGIFKVKARLQEFQIERSSILETNEGHVFFILAKNLAFCSCSKTLVKVNLKVH